MSSRCNHDLWYELGKWTMFPHQEEVPGGRRVARMEESGRWRVGPIYNGDFRVLTRKAWVTSVDELIILLLTCGTGVGLLGQATVAAYICFKLKLWAFAKAMQLKLPCASHHQRESQSKLTLRMKMRAGFGMQNNRTRYNTAALYMSSCQYNVCMCYSQPS